MVSTVHSEYSTDGSHRAGGPLGSSADKHVLSRYIFQQCAARAASDIGGRPAELNSAPNLFPLAR
jgi:hypothetical protein